MPPLFWANVVRPRAMGGEAGSGFFWRSPWGIGPFVTPPRLVSVIEVGWVLGKWGNPARWVLGPGVTERALGLVGSRFGASLVVPFSGGVGVGNPPKRRYPFFLGKESFGPLLGPPGFPGFPLILLQRLALFGVPRRPFRFPRLACLGRSPLY